MSAFIIVDIDVHDPVRYEDYKRMASESIAQYGGRYLVRGGRSEVLSGSWTPKRLVVLQFDSVEAAKRWQSSPEYTRARAVRDSVAKANMIVVEGL